MNHYGDMVIMDLFCFEPPVMSLLASQVISLPHPLPRCLALGSSSVCCTLCAPPGHPAMPGGQQQISQFVIKKHLTNLWRIDFVSVL